ncbi:hypothetical protein BW685_25425 [Burkholderia ubonensis]|uniref:Uncharacterized protein n=1 Tax=Burkholderia ubonensis TaxID=101571 RepID=A0A1R1J5R2_9BURK|nr:hypothetical protein BW685_25425 [Burkholderia ubonensis]
MALVRSSRIGRVATVPALFRHVPDTDPDANERDQTPVGSAQAIGSSPPPERGALIEFPRVDGRDQPDVDALRAIEVTADRLLVVLVEA